MKKLIKSEEAIGYILWVSERDGDGIIIDKEKDPKNSNEFYFDASSMINRDEFNSLKRGMKVMFISKRLMPDNILVGKKVKIL